MLTPAFAMSASGTAMASGAPMANLNMIAQKTAMTKFEAGPAAATHSMSFLGLRKAPKLTGTGFAQPNKIPPNMTVKAGSKMAVSYTHLLQLIQ